MLRCGLLNIVWGFLGFACWVPSPVVLLIFTVDLVLLICLLLDFASMRDL